MWRLESDNLFCGDQTNHKTSAELTRKKTMDAERSEMTGGFGEAARFGFKRTIILFN